MQINPTRNGTDTEPTDCTADTDAFGALNGVKGASVRARYCRTGSYFGVIPRKLANGRLLWPHVQVCAGEHERDAA